MSTFYDTEPQPTASVVLHTTSGEIAVELFAKQTPLTCRNFLQHCLDGYYDNTTFHRLVPGFVLQGGDPTGTGQGGESIYDGGALAGDLDPWPMDERRGANAGPHGVGFRDEFHSRLKFNRRGLLGMANEGRPDTNGSQFFFTLDKADELTNKNTLFGRVAGPTVYNLTKMGQGEVQEGTDRPLYPARIARVEILTNPFADMRKTERDASRPGARPPPAAADDRKRAKRKKGVNKNLLSFGDDVEDDLEMGPVVVAGPSSSSQGGGRHSKKAKLDKDGSRREKSSKPDQPPETKEEKARPERAEQPSTTALPSRGHPDRDRPRSPAAPAKRRPAHSDGEDDERSASDSERDEAPRKAQPTALERTNAEIAALKASMRRTAGVPARRAASEDEDEDEDEDKGKDGKSVLDKLVPKDATRGKKLSRKNGMPSHDPKVLRMLDAFTSRLGQSAHGAASASPKTAAGGGSSGDSDKGEDKGKGKGKDKGKDKGDGDGDGDGTGEGTGEVCDLHFIANCQSCRPWDAAEDGHGAGSDSEDDWMAHTLNCAADKLGKDLSYRKKAEEELIVIDPREKARTLQEERRGGGRGGGRDGRGGGGRAWDQARHAKMMQAASLSGRGAR